MDDLFGTVSSALGRKPDEASTMRDMLNAEQLPPPSYQMNWQGQPMEAGTGNVQSNQNNNPSGFDSSIVLNAVKNASLQPSQMGNKVSTPKSIPQSPPGAVTSTLAGIGHGVGNTALGAQQLLGRGLSAVGLDQAGEWLQKDAAMGINKLSNEDAPYSQAHPLANDIGQIGGGIASALALPLGKTPASGANLINKLIYAAKTGAIVGAAQPVTNTEDFWGEKARQIGASAGVEPQVNDAINFWKEKALQTAAGGAAGVIGYPVGAALGKVTGTIANSASNLGQNIYNKLTGKVNPVMESVANASPELQASVKSAINRGENINPTFLSRQLEADSLPVKMSLTPGQTTQDPVLISKERNLRGKNPALAYKFNDQNNQLVQNIEVVGKNSAPDVSIPDNFVAGNNLIDALQNKISQQKSITQRAYKALEEANGGTLPLDGQAFAISANQQLGKNMKGSFLPTQIQNILADFQTGKQPMTFENFENLRTILGSEARAAQRSGNGNVEAAINTVRNSLESMPMTNESGPMKALADTARASAKQGFDLENNVPAYKAVANGNANPDDFVKKYLINGKTADIKNIASIVHDDPEALQTIKASVINHLQDKAVNQTGNFSQSSYNNTLDSLKPKLGMIFSPDEVNQLETIGKVGKYIQSQPTGSFVNNSNTDVSHAARAAGNMAAHVFDVATNSPAGSIANNVISSGIAQKASSNQLKSILNPGAGISTPGQSSQFLKNQLPNISGNTFGIPLSQILSNFVTNKNDKNTRRNQ